MFRYLTALFDHIVHYKLAPAHRRIAPEGQAALDRLKAVDRQIEAGVYQGSDVRGTRAYAFHHIPPRERLIAANKGRDVTGLTPRRERRLSVAGKKPWQPLLVTEPPRDPEELAREREDEASTLRASAEHLAKRAASRLMRQRLGERYAPYRSLGQEVLSNVGLDATWVRAGYQQAIDDAHPIAATPDEV
ncbi:hypothetical protein HOU02_gp183 [Caulobacter phage CcrBL9]|uniref:Uncharacterized protein n=1 Tax=Caulobacter phage CcrBL9 TaxID=2283270 RepID=A0A385EBD9_9CAUD|nr:hypothetical protein HOU02_gp002 [Caulobacter phage CcrBL9]YP_009810172.1 hypothetical protein HOU02_gp183 [Caulobacter phage CcrBL9]AXQ69026.1 hypothetical protein CcrBL9_gp002 [Caulobacter phage CcrBL9]AXQ69542.1 hypothetical protein CcrBL9_gp518 [Caulobacter phage CcrBL9]